MPRRWSCSSGLQPVYLATAQALDGEMAERIRQHRARRGDALADGRGAAGPARGPGGARPARSRAVLVDCLTLWLTNLMLAERDVADAGDRLLAVLGGAPGPVVLVSNEVGLGIVPLGELSRAFVDHAGRLHQRLAALADWVRLIVAGLPLDLKTPRAVTRAAMHLLSTLAADGSDVEAAVDLGQTPGEIVFLSAADSDLACLAAAQARLGRERPEPAPRQPAAARPPALGRPLCRARRRPAPGSSLVRLLGGRGYWPYGLEQVAACCARARHRAGLPARRRARRPRARRALDPAARGASSGFGRYLQHGGIDNAEQALRYAAALIGRPADWSEPLPLPRAGLYRPAAGRARAGPRPSLVFYRALVQSGDLAPIDALLDALAEAGLAATGLYVAEPEGPGRRHAGPRDRSPACAPDVILNATAFAVGAIDGAAGDDPLAGADAPVLQVDPGRQHRGRLARGRARPGPARSRHARGPARGRRPHRRRGRLVQARRRARSAPPRPSSPATGRCPTASPTWPHWPRPGRGCAATPAARAPRRHRARQLPDPRRPARQRRRPGRAGQLHRGAERPGPGRLRASRDVPADGAALVRPPRRRPDQRARRPRAARVRGRRCRSPTTAQLFASLPGEVRARGRGALGRAGARPAPRRRRLRPLAPAAGPAWSSACSPPAATTSTRTPPTTRRTSPRRTATSPSISGCATRFGAHADRPSRQARQPRMAARQGHRPLRRLPARGRARAAAASLPVHRQRPRRGHAGQAPRRPR